MQQTFGNSPNNPPIQLMSLIGREQEMAHIRLLLGREDVRFSSREFLSSDDAFSAVIRQTCEWKSYSRDRRDRREQRIMEERMDDAIAGTEQLTVHCLRQVRGRSTA